MNILTWFLLVTLVVWSKANNVTISEHSNVPTRDLLNHLIHHIHDNIEDDDNLQNDDADELLEDYDSSMESPDNEQSESANIESINGTDSNLMYLLKNHNMNPNLERLKERNPQLFKYASIKDHHILNDIVRNLISQNQTIDEQHSNKFNESNVNLEKKPKHSLSEMRKLYEGLKAEPKDISNQETNADSTYEDLRSLINSYENRPYEDSGEYYSVPASNEMSPSLANFYVASDPNSFHAYETKNNHEHKDIKDQSSKLSTVKELISTSKDPDKQGSYVPVENDNYHQYLSCCEQLFKKYGNKQYIHEDIYLVPKGFPKLTVPEHKFVVRYPPHMRPMPYFKGYPLPIGPEGKIPVISTNRGFPPMKGGPIDCRHDGQHIFHSDHYMPTYHGSHYPPPIYRPPPSAMAALLLKKKLALIGKKYLLG